MMIGFNLYRESSDMQVDSTYPEDIDCDYIFSVFTPTYPTTPWNPWLSTPKEPKAINSIDLQRIGSKVRMRRKELGLSIQEIAKKLQVTSRYINSLERDWRPWRGPKTKAYLELLRMNQEANPSDFSHPAEGT